MEQAWAGISEISAVDSEAIGRFSCGHEELDDWFHKNAAVWSRIGRCKVHVAIEGGRVVGFFSLSPICMVAAEFPKSARHGKTSVDLPGWLIGRLAVDEGLKGRGIGTALLYHAIKRACELSDMAGGVAIVIDPKDEKLATWYEKIGFKNPTGAFGRMFLTMKSARSMIANLGEDYFVF